MAIPIYLSRKAEVTTPTLPLAFIWGAFAAKLPISAGIPFVAYLAFLLELRWGVPEAKFVFGNGVAKR